MSTSLQTTTAGLIAVRGDDIEVSAFQPQEMLDANSALIEWAKRKIASIKAEAADLLAAYEHAKLKKWKTSTLKRHHDLAERRGTFYEKMKSALEHGFYIVPNFPVTCFAIRTGRDKPLATFTDKHWINHEQKAQTLPAGEGEYKNPFPLQCQRDISSPEDKAKNKKVMEYWADAFDEFEFPVQMAKAHIMEVTSRAMALKLFDDFGVLPGHTKADPIVVGRIKDPRSPRYAPKFITFIIAWHLDTRTL